MERIVKSIIFNQHQVNHALKNKEGMFRVVVKPQPQPNGGKGFHPVFPYETPSGRWNWVLDTGMGTGDPFHAPYQVGETIFVKESWRIFGWVSDPIGASPVDGLKLAIEYQEDKAISRTYYPNNVNYQRIKDLVKSYEDEMKIRSPRTMPQWASRLTLKIKSVKVERLQDISEEDAIKEGVEKCGDAYFPLSSQNNQDCCSNFKEAFRIDWNSTHKKPEEKWEANPFVFCFSYEVVR